MVDLGSISGGFIWLLFGAVLFGVLLPFLTAEAVLKVWDSRSPGKEPLKSTLGVAKKMLLGWLCTVPVYILSFYYF